MARAATLKDLYEIARSAYWRFAILNDSCYGIFTPIFVGISLCSEKEKTWLDNGKCILTQIYPSCSIWNKNCKKPLFVCCNDINKTLACEEPWSVNRAVSDSVKKVKNRYTKVIWQQNQSKEVTFCETPRSNDIRETNSLQMMVISKKYSSTSSYDLNNLQQLMAFWHSNFNLLFASSN